MLGTGVATRRIPDGARITVDGDAGTVALLDAGAGEPDPGHPLVQVGAPAYAGLVALPAWQALRGRPLLAPDATTLAALAVLLPRAAGAGALVVRRA